MKKQYYFLLIALFGVFSNLSAQVTPVACYPFNSDALDFSGNNHHGSVAGATLTEDRFGNANSAFLFDGVNDSILIVDTLSQLISGDELTIVFWAKANASGMNSPFLLMPDNFNDRLNIHIHYMNGTTPTTFWDYGNPSNGGRLSYTTPFTSQWDHYAFVISQSNDFMGIYKNGVLEASKTTVSTLINKNKFLSIGGGLSGITNCHFNGVIDDVQIFDQALDQTEVLDNFSNSSTCINDQLSWIKGRIFYDFNTNGVQDSTEIGIPNVLMQAVGTPLAAVTDINGDYNMGIATLGTYDIIANFNVSYYGTVPASHSVTLTALQQVDSLNDFAVQPLANVDDLRIHISPLGAFRPGFSGGYNISYHNDGTTAQSGIITLKLDSVLTYDNSSEVPFYVSNDTVQWVTPTLLPFESGSFNVWVDIATTASLGDLVNSTALIEPIVSDPTPVNNLSNWEVTVTGSYDPNDIAVNHEFYEEVISATPPLLTYLIRFQNTGTDTAFTVVVKNKLPIELELNTFRLLNTSHICHATIDNSLGELIFTFNNILLADSNTNEAQSHGFIQYSIEPQENLPLGTQIINNARIYFDFNLPVITNDAITTIISTVGLQGSDESSINAIKISPNPSNSFSTLSVANLKPLNEYTVNILDLSCKQLSLTKVYSDEYGNLESQLNLASLSKGMYFVEISAMGYKAYAKIVKN
ncbi:MAG: T9SS type A sorting domain-containing protein [Bacteroidia bacterium]|nr:T9SS type A sorting domain-containing protein [Bacteroidia bacterium]